MEAQDLGHPSGPVNDPVRLAQNRGNVVSLNGLQTGARLGRRDRGRRGQNAWFDLEDAVRLEDDSPLEDVLQLADVTRPAILQELLHGALADALDALADPTHEVIDEKVREERDVLGTIAERREMNGEDVQSVVKILAESFFLNRFQEVAVGGGDDADIDPHRKVAADAFEFMRLQNVKQLGLDLGRNLANLIEEDDAAVGELEAADALGDGAREGPFLMAEELAFHEARRQGAAVDLDKKLVARLLVE